MNRLLNSRPLILVFVVLVAASLASCSMPTDEPSTSSSTHWLGCDSVADCDAYPGASECEDNYCVDSEGERIAVLDFNDDSDCADDNVCNEEICKDDHTCAFGKDLPDGTECGDQRSCWAGVCVDNMCGDAIIQGEEECDDGDLDPANGCKPDCTFTCEKDLDCENGDECAGAGTCNAVKHICTGNPLPNESSCAGGAGWCQGGVCVPLK